MRQMRFERVDRPTRWDTIGFWGDTVTRWRLEGLPEDVSPEEYFGMETQIGFPVKSGLVNVPYDPVFEYRELERDGDTVVFQSESGVIQRGRLDGNSMPQWLRFPVESRKDFATICEERLNANTASRYPNWDEVHKQFDDRDQVMYLHICGTYGTPRSLMGENKLAYVFYDDPDFVHEILRWWLNFYTELITIVTQHYSDIDYLYLWEDMSHKTGPLISPDFVKRFMSPYYEPLIDHIKSCGIDIVMLDTDGNAEVLLDMFLDAGVNALLPFEIAANMEPLPIRRHYGHRLAMIGGIDKRAIAAGRAEMKQEVMRKVPDLLQDGGFVPAVDHLVPPDIFFDNYRAFVDLIRELGEKYGG